MCFVKGTILIAFLFHFADGKRYDFARDTVLSVNHTKLVKAGVSVINEVNIKAWTWNSGTKDMLPAIVARLFESSYSQHVQPSSSAINLLAVCQTEAKISLKGLMEKDQKLRERWTLVSHATHTGFSGGTFNSQILSVFLEQPKDGPKWNVSKGALKRKSGKGGVGMARVQKDTMMGRTLVHGLMDVDTKIHQTSRSGKGGASALLGIHRSEFQDAFNVAITCSHLDSEATFIREKGTQKIKEEVGDVDAMLLFGDLNYRLYRDAPIAGIPADLQDEASSLQFAKLLASEAGREQLALADPLNPHGVKPASLISELDFQCNRNYGSLPSYKRKGSPQNCSDLVVALKICHQTTTNPFMVDTCTATDENAKLVENCFAGGPAKWKYKDNGMKPPAKKQPKHFLQLGWLDRVCLRQKPNAGFKMEFLDDAAGRFEWDFITGSDHAPVESVVRFSDF